MSNVVEDARGKWNGIFSHFGISLKPRRHGPCPVCGGKDRFIFDDKQGRGTYYCSHCGAGSGFMLLSSIKGWTMKQTMNEVKVVVGTVERKVQKEELSDEDRKKQLNETWTGAKDIVVGDPVYNYLYNRTGLKEHPKSLRYHPDLWQPDAKSGLPAMVAKVVGPDNKPISIHRTWLTAEGEKATLERSRMLMAGSLVDGAAIRLFPYTDTLGIAEGIETAISAFAIFGIPTWAATSAPMLLKWTPPDVIKNVWVFGDNDHSFTGQSAAYKLGNALRATQKFASVQVAVPDILGADWNDVLTLLGNEVAKEKVRERRYG